MLQTVARRRTLVLLDFLAPSLISKVSTSATTVPEELPSVSPHPVPPVIIEKLKKQLAFIHAANGHAASSSQAKIFNDALAKIRQALEQMDVVTVARCWEQLERNKLLHFLGPSHLRMISESLTRSFIPPGDRPWQPSTQQLVESVALLAAAGGSTDALNVCMLVHIRRGNPDAVIRLYQKFMSMVREEGKKDVEDDVGKQESQQNSALAVGKKSNFYSHPPGRVHLLLAITTAHAMHSSFGGALQVCLKSPVRFHAYSTEVFTDKLGFDQDLQQRVRFFVRRLNTAMLVARPPSLSKQITNLSTPAGLKMLQTLYQSIVMGFSGLDAYLAADPSGITPARPVSMTEVGWTSFLVAFLKVDRRDLASKVWSDMAHFGVKPGISMWTALIDAYDNKRAVDEALAAWNMMLAQGLKPDGLAYRAIISTLFNGRKTEEAMKMFQTFRKDFLSNCPPHHALSVYNTVLHGLLYAEHIDEAGVVLRSMELKGPAPDIVSYNTFLAYHGKRGNFKALAAVVTKMASMKLTGDVFSFSTILSALLKAGREDAPEMMLSIMEKQGIRPNVATYSAIIDHQMRERQEKNLQAAMRMLSRMEQDPELHPNEVTYTSILAGLYRSPWLSAQKTEEWRLDIVDRMRKRGIQFNLPTYHILIKACLEYPHPDGLNSALGYYQDMVGRGVPLVNTTWYILLAGLLQRREWKIGEELIKDMERTDLQPTGALLELVSKIRRRTVPDLEEHF